MDDDTRRRDAARGAELVRRFRAGDESAFRELWERFRGALEHRVERSLPARLRRRVAVSDVLQESLLAAYGRRETLEHENEDAFRAWLLTITGRKVQEVVRHHEEAGKRSARREVTRQGGPDTEIHAARQSTPSQAAAGAELQSLSRHAMRRLPADYREVLHLVHHESLTLGQAAERMGRSREAMKKLYGRALLRFRDEFGKLGGTRP